MRNLLRNTQTISYKNYTARTEIVDSFGCKTGEYTNTYGTIKTLRACVSAGYGKSMTEEFGQYADYDRTIITTDTAVDIDENSIVWIDAQTSGPHDYIVTKKVKWKNSVVIGIKRVAVSA